MTEMTLIEALEKLALITKKGLDEWIQIPNNASEPITIGEAIKAIKTHVTDISETENYAISRDGIKKVKDDGSLDDIVYQVVEDV